MDSDKLGYLAEFIRIRNVADQGIARFIGRAPHPDSIAAFVASRIFDIELQPTPGRARFRSGPFKDRSVQVQYASRNNGTLAMVKSDHPADHPDVYLVITGQRSDVTPVVDTVTPWVVTNVYLFRTEWIIDRLISHGIEIGTATHVPKHLWEQAAVYPKANPSLYPISSRQRSALELFAPVFDED